MDEKNEKNTIKVLVELNVDKGSILTKLEQIEKHARELSWEAYAITSALKLSEKEAPEQSDAE